MSFIIDFDATVSGKSLTLSYPVLQQGRVKPRFFCQITMLLIIFTAWENFADKLAMGRTWKKNNLSLQAKNPSFNIKIPVKIVQASKNSKKYQATVASTSVCTIPDLCALTFWILLEISISQSRPMESETNNKTFWVLIHTKTV